MNKRIIGLMAPVLLGLTALAGCGSSSDTGSSQPASSAGTGKQTADAAIHAMLPDAVKNAGTITVATDASYPPFEFFDTDNKTIIGADAELAQALGDVMGVKMPLQNTDFSGIVPGIAAGKFSVAMSGLADTATRQQQITFVDYAANGDAFLVNKGANYPSWASLCGLNVAVQSGTTMVDDVQTASTKCTEAGKKAITSSNYTRQEEGVLALRSGRSSVLVSTGGSAAYIATQSNGQFTVVNPSDPLKEAGVLGIGVAKDQTQLAQALQKALKVLVDNGTYDKIMKKWNLADCCANKAGTINGGH
jgi:polar amino acid transport system substrate-binding protein